MFFQRTLYRQSLDVCFDSFRSVELLGILPGRDKHRDHTDQNHKLYFLHANHLLYPAVNFPFPIFQLLLLFAVLK